jgi:hypothetical protein
MNASRPPTPREWHCGRVHGDTGEKPVFTTHCYTPFGMASNTVYKVFNAGFPGWTEIGNFIVQISTDISAILPDAAALVNILTPIVKGVFTLLHLGKKKQDAIGNPYIALGLDNHFVEVGGPDQKRRYRRMDS